MPHDPTLPRLRDADLTKTIALSNGAGSVTSNAIDLGPHRKSGTPELLILAPALTTTQLPNTETMTYIVEFAAATGFSTITRSITVGVQTGAGGAGAVADEYRCGVASDADQYCRLKVTKTGTGNASTVSGTIGVAA